VCTVSSMRLKAQLKRGVRLRVPCTRLTCGTTRHDGNHDNASSKHHSQIPILSGSDARAILFSITGAPCEHSRVASTRAFDMNCVHRRKGGAPKTNASCGALHHLASRPPAATHQSNLEAPSRPHESYAHSPSLMPRRARRSINDVMSGICW